MGCCMHVAIFTEATLQDNSHYLSLCLTILAIIPEGGLHVISIKPIDKICEHSDITKK